MLVKNITIHPETGVSVEAFGNTLRSRGAARLVPLHGEKPGEALILDRDACLALAAGLTQIAGVETVAVADLDATEADELTTLVTRAEDLGGYLHVEIRKHAAVTS